jgi:hypothetical protein
LKIYLEKGKCEMAKADQPAVKEVKIIAPVQEVKTKASKKSTSKRLRK